MIIKLCPYELNQALINYLNNELGCDLDPDTYMEVFINARAVGGKNKPTQVFMIPAQHLAEDEVEIFIETNKDF